MSFVSIGPDCRTATLLQILNLKKESYPFDWIAMNNLSDNQQCLLDDFNEFLNKENYSINEQGHDINNSSKWSKSIEFIHHPIIKDYEYYKRCCDRFINLKNNDCVFVYVTLNEKKWTDFLSKFQNFYLKIIEIYKKSKILIFNYIYDCDNIKIDFVKNENINILNVSIDKLF